MRNRLLIALSIGVLSGLLCYQARIRVFPGPGDFNWALDTARALLSGRDPYAFEPSALRIPYPLPVALFGVPFLWLPPPAAGATFFGLSTTLLAYSILRSGQPWRLFVFGSFPFFYALIFAQWSPLIMASWFVPVLAPLLVLVKPQIALPVAVNRVTRRGVFVAGIVLLASLAVYPTWPLRWRAMLGQYEQMLPLLTLPLGPLLLLAVVRWRDERARLILGMAALPLRGAYDLVPLWLAPGSFRQALLLTLCSWLMPLANLGVAMMVRPAWVVPVLYLPALAFIIWPKSMHQSGTYNTASASSARI